MPTKKGKSSPTVAAEAPPNKDDKKEEAKIPAMKYRMLGNTGMQVSVLSYGFFANYGAKDSLQGTSGIEAAKSVLRTIREYGVNFFDHAETYGNPEGEAERIFGKALKELQKEAPNKWRRSDILVTTKIFWGLGLGVNEKGLSNKHITEGLDACLARLQLDYVDVVYAHRPDPLTPTITVVRAFTNAIRKGKAMCWGTSEWSAQQITEAFWLAKTEGLEPPMVEQPCYHMFSRTKMERELVPLFREPYNLATTTYSPLAQGLLTGKYTNGEPPADSRMSTYSWMADRIVEWRRDGKFMKLQELEKLHKSLGCSMTQLAIAWCLTNKNVSTVLLGGSKPEQLVECLGALAVVPKLGEEQLKIIADALANKPEPYTGYGTPNDVRELDTI